MLALRAEHRTGVLDVRGGDVHTLIHFREGNPIFAEDAGLSGAIVPQLPQVDRARREQARAAILRSLQRDGSWWAFDDSAERRRPEASFFLDMESMVLEVMRQLPSERKIADVFSEKMDQRLGVLGDPSELATRFDMAPSELAFLQKLTAPKTVRDLFADAPSSEVDAPALLGTLVLFGAAALSPPSGIAPRKAATESEQALQRGMIAMSEGDDATAKKHFYEALRLDPESPAKQQVRRLALRTTPPPPVAGESMRPPEPVPVPVPVRSVEKVETKLEVEKAPSQAPPASAQPGRTTPTVRPAALMPVATSKPIDPPGTSKTALILGAVVVLGVAAILGMTQTSPSVPTMPTPSLISPQAVEKPAAAPTAIASVKPIAPVAVPIDPPVLPEKIALKSDTGAVRLPPGAAGHRVFVDGHLEKDGMVVLVLPCGAHVIQIGSHGAPKSIDVLCGQEIRLE